MDHRSILIGLNELSGIGWKTILKIISTYPDLKDIWELGEKEWRDLGLKIQIINKITAHLNQDFILFTMHAYDEIGINIITIYDETYPHALKEISEPPWILYCKGDAALLQLPSLAIVGTRNPTSYGKRIADEFALSLSNFGFTIVSGMAKGIDGAAHRGALRGTTGTIAVLGCAVNKIYPPENTLLYYDICTNGLMLSEYPLSTKFHPGLFPRRNRIIAGLSLGTIVVEAAKRSGSLITADAAMDESRDVFAIPGPITSEKSHGTLELIKQGAKVVTQVEDIIEEYKHIIGITNHTNEKAPKVGTTLNDDEQLVYDLLSTIPTTFDDLLEKSKFHFGHLHSILLSLLMKKQIEQLPGSSFITLY